MIAEEAGEGGLVERIRGKIHEIYGPRESKISNISLGDYVEGRIGSMKPEFAHRDIELITRTQVVPGICVPEDVLKKVVDGLVRNAIEATPDEGRIEVTVQKKGDLAELIVHDCGIGITEDNRERIFEGFFSTQETMAYSSKRPYDFFAGGKGADLLRMKIFSERFNFRIEMESSRCTFIPEDKDLCPGRISECKFCKTPSDCRYSGGTYFRVLFPPAPDQGCALLERTEAEEGPWEKVPAE